MAPKPSAEPEAQLRRERDELTSQNTQMRADRERLQESQLADTSRELRDNSATSTRAKELESALTKAQPRCRKSLTGEVQATPAYPRSCKELPAR